MPTGNPALVKPIKIGTLEQEQNGVTVPSSAAIIFPVKPSKCVKIRFVFSGGNTTEYMISNKLKLLIR